MKVGVGGLEPTNGGVKVRCLTTWLHPKIDIIFITFVESLNNKKST
jgi:hypothetical protein